jgi:hypothetical protein
LNRKRRREERDHDERHHQQDRQLYGKTFRQKEAKQQPELNRIRAQARALNDQRRAEQKVKDAQMQGEKERDQRKIREDPDPDLVLSRKHFR